MRQNNDNQNIIVLDFLTLDYTKPCEPATAISSGNVPLNEQAPVNSQLRSADIENKQSGIENTRMQSNNTTTGMQLANTQHSINTSHISSYSAAQFKLGICMHVHSSRVESTDF